MEQDILLYIESTQSWLERRLAEIDSNESQSTEWKQIEKKCAFQPAYEGLVSDIKGVLNER